VKKCEEWLEKNHREMHEKLYSEGGCFLCYNRFFMETSHTSFWYKAGDTSPTAPGGGSSLDQKLATHSTCYLYPTTSTPPL